MVRRFWIESALVCALALGACNKAGNQAPAPVDTTNNGVSNTGGAMGSAESATSAAVGQVAAATTFTAEGFVTGAATSDMFEIAAAKLALDRGADPAIKTFAKRMIHDHTASTAKLKALIASAGLNVTPPAEMDERRKGMINNLTAASDADFDKLYLEQQVGAHEEAVTLFKGYADHGDNAALKDFAVAVLPTIEAHLAMAKSMKAGMSH